MTRLTAKDFAPELLELYDYYAHGQINRREFLDRAALLTVGGTALSLLTALCPNYALAEQVSFTDPAIVAEYVMYPSPNGNGQVRLKVIDALLTAAGNDRRLGVSTGNIAKILGLSLATNWFGYMALAGVIFSSGLVTMPPGWKVSTGALQGIGVVLVLLSLGYLAACQFSKKREWSVRGMEINLPSVRMACLQLALGALNWSLMAAVIFTLLPAKLDYPLVLGVLLISAIAGVITHIPAGLGVLEAVFIGLLQHEASRGSLLAGLIAYRAIYFILPLLIALVMYLGVEAKAKALRVKKAPA